jgi:hypothetical protein
MTAWKAALAAAIATAVIALIVIAPMAQSSKSHPGLRVVSVDGFGHGAATARCPRGFTPIAGGFSSVDGAITHSFRSSRRSWRVEIDASEGNVSSIATCVKPIGGFNFDDAGER